MKSKQPEPSFLVPKLIGRAEGYMVANNKKELETYRETMTRQAKLQILAMFGLSNPKLLDQPQAAKVADIARAMGYEQLERTDGKRAFHPDTYNKIEETGLRLRAKPIDVYIRESYGNGNSGHRKYREKLVEMSILQEFGFLYEDECGEPINLNEMAKDKLIKYEDSLGSPLYAIPMTDKNGRFIRNKDGTLRRKMANGVTWTFSRTFAELAKKMETSWVFYIEAVHILKRYLSKPASFDLMFNTLFFGNDGLIEYGHQKLVKHLDIKSKDEQQVNVAIDNAFKDALREGIIDKPVNVRLSRNSKVKGEVNMRHRKNVVYEWQKAARWGVGKDQNEVSSDEIERDEDKDVGKPES